MSDDTIRIESTDPEPFMDRLEDELNGDPDAMADVIAQKTTLDDYEGLLVALSHLGYDEEEIGDELARSGMHVERELGELRKKRAMIREELEKMRRTMAALQPL